MNLTRFLGLAYPQVNLAGNRALSGVEAVGFAVGGQDVSLAF